MSQAAASRPDRLLGLDALRGLALFGILVVNSAAFASPYYGTGLVDPAFARPLDQAVRGLVSLLFETKFYLLFSFLFGYSFTLQMDAADRAGAAFVPRFLRRLGGLAVIGLAHGLLFFHGDILSTYALLGLVLLALRRWEPARALKLGAALVAACAAAWGVLGLLVAWQGGPGNPAAGMIQAQSALAAYQGTVATTVAQHARELGAGVWAVLLLTQGPCAFGLFLAGLAAGRRKFLASPGNGGPWPRRLVLAGLPIGGAGALGYVLLGRGGEASGLLGLALDLATAPFLAAAYLGLALLGFQTRPGQRLVRLLAPAGRMALSNYLIQSVACSFIFTAYGWRLHGRVAPLGVLLIAVVIYACQLILSAWWLRRHAYGPLEWLLRALTNARWPAWRQGAGPVSPSESGTGPTNA
ncbi:MAG: DUF418 domain-containing protein [Acidobacteria bacterium]|nr:DUF418 domain-containing protein [Acidobacteriota bacterium]MBI3487831.1 DUF418 domain-containing protein [Acidobacteriota bacterium]